MNKSAKFEPLYGSAHATSGHVLRPVARAVAVLRAGDAVILKSAGKAVLLVSAESGWKDHAFTQVVMTAMRARALGLEMADKEAKAIVLPWQAGEDAGQLSVSPSKETPAALQNAPMHEAGEVEEAALQLLKYAFMLPVGLLANLSAEEAENFTAEYGVVSVDADLVALYPQAAADHLVIAGEATVPLKSAQNSKVLVFRQPYGIEEHLAIVVGDLSQEKKPLLVRVHSSCVTGDILGSLRCDCGDQLQAALKMIAGEGSGVVLYLNQEGRGIGLANKMKAYALQEAGMDTVDANEALGFDADERDFTAAAAMLKLLGLSKIRLLTNNPRKVDALSELGVEVAERVGLAPASNPHNEAYLKTKETRCGHLF